MGNSRAWRVSTMRLKRIVNDNDPLSRLLVFKELFGIVTDEWYTADFQSLQRAFQRVVIRVVTYLTIIGFVSRPLGIEVKEVKERVNDAMGEAEVMGPWPVTMIVDQGKSAPESV